MGGIVRCSARWSQKTPNWPVRWAALLDTPERQPGTRQEVLVCDFVQRPDPRIVGDLGSESEGSESTGGVVASWRQNRFQENAKTRPGSESRQPEAEEPVGLRNGFWTRHTTAHGVIFEDQHGPRAVGPFVKKPMGAAKVLHAVSQRKQGPVRVLGIPVQVAMGQRSGIEEEMKPKAPEEREVTQGRGHGGEKREWCAVEEREQKGSRS
jgi:hypothetical protein